MYFVLHTRLRVCTQFKIVSKKSLIQSIVISKQHVNCTGMPVLKSERKIIFIPFFLEHRRIKFCSHVAKQKFDEEINFFPQSFQNTSTILRSHGRFEVGIGSRRTSHQQQWFIATRKKNSRKKKSSICRTMYETANETHLNERENEKRLHKMKLPLLNAISFFFD